MKHPSSALLSRHALGDLPTAVWVVVDAHVQSCPVCTETISGIEQAEGDSLADAAFAPLAPEALEQALAALDTPPPKPDSRSGRLGDVTLPYAIAQKGLQPRRWLMPGLWAAFADLPEEDGWRALILRAPAGTAIPHHGHEGEEYISVLQGSFRDRVRYRAGDFLANPADRDHDLRVDKHGPCVCAIAIKGAIHWQGLAKVITPVMGV